MIVRPLQDRVLVARTVEETTTPGGIVIPDAAREKPAQGTVIAIGPGKVLEDGSVRPVTVKVNDTVLFAKFAGTEVKIDDQTHLIMREDDILGVVEAA